MPALSSEFYPVTFQHDVNTDDSGYDGGSALPETFHLLLESGSPDNLLLEDNSNLLLQTAP